MMRRTQVQIQYTTCACRQYYTHVLVIRVKVHLLPRNVFVLQLHVMNVLHNSDITVHMDEASLSQTTAAWGFGQLIQMTEDYILTL